MTTDDHATGADPDGHEADDEHEPVPAVHADLLGAGGALDSVMPVLLFIGVRSIAGLPWAIAAATLWSIRSAVVRRRKGLGIGWFMPLVVVYLIARGVLGVVTDSEAVYFGIGFATKVAIGLGLLVSVLIGRDLIGEVAPRVLPFDRETRAHPRFRATTRTLTLIAAAFELLTSVWDIWLYNNASVNEFLIVRLFAGWFMGFVTIFASLIYANRQLSKIPSFPGLFAMLEDLPPVTGASAPRRPSPAPEPE